MKELLLLLLCSIAVAAPACPYYLHKDYVDTSNYHQPQQPADTILQYCNFNFNSICILANAFNTTEDKKLFVVEAIGNNSYENIFQWNQKIAFGKWFNVTKSSINIKDAWVNLAYFSPSVYDNGTYILNSMSQIFTKQNFTFVVDQRLIPEDCKDIYRICGYDYSVNIHKNNSNINATLNVQSEYLVVRYHIVSHCEGKVCYVSCDYYKTDDNKDSVSVSDSKKIQYENFTPSSNYFVNDTFNGLGQIVVNATDPNLHFQIGNSSFDKIAYTYKIRYEIEPYNVLLKEIVPLNRTTTYGLSILDQNNTAFVLLAPYSENCSLTIYGNFESKIISGCQPVQNNTDQFQKIPVKIPEFFSSIFYLALTGLGFYFLYKIGKKVMKND